MPQLIEYLDKIARDKQRDVLCLSFLDSSMEIDELLDMNFEQYKPFVEMSAWLDANGIKWQSCALQSGIASSGRIYVDVPFDESDPLYQKLASYLENPDGSMKLEGLKFFYMSLAQAMEFAEQDEPGYWDNYWKNDFEGV
jgi:hypothetical protein